MSVETEKKAENAVSVPLGDGAGNGDAAVPETEFRGGKEGAKAFSQRLNAVKDKWEQEYRERLFQELGFRNPHTGEAVRDAVTLRNVLEEAAREQSEILAAEAGRREEIRTLRELLCAAQDREEEEELKRDPVLGEFFEQYGRDAKEIAAYARKNGQAIPLVSAFHALLMENLPVLMSGAAEKARADALKKMEENRMATPVALGGEVAENGVDYAAMSDAEFDRILRRALNGELKRI